MIKSCRRRALPAARRSMPNYPEPKFRGPKRTKAPRVISSQNLEPENDFNLCSLSPGWSCTSTLTAACACPPSGRSARPRFATFSPASSEWIFQGLALPGDGSLEALTGHVEMAAPANLTAFLSGFQVWLESISRAHFKKSIRISQINRSLTSVHSTSSYW